jgi:transposase
MLHPVVRRTWGPKGQTPLFYAWERYDRLSVISAITVSPERHRLKLYFRARRHNLRTAEVRRFLASLHRRRPRGMILILDRWGVHRSAARQHLDRFGKTDGVEWLPPYAPELNPVEQAWTNTKCGVLANYAPDNLEILSGRVRRTLRRTQGQTELLGAFFAHAKLKLKL